MAIVEAVLIIVSTHALTSYFIFSDSMDLFVAIVRRHGEGHVVNFTIITLWQLILESIRDRWGLQLISIRVRYIIQDEHRTSC